jgi:hypothetical protein
LCKHIAHDRAGGDPLTGCNGLTISLNPSCHQCK